MLLGFSITVGGRNFRLETAQSHCLNLPPGRVSPVSSSHTWGVEGSDSKVGPSHRRGAPPRAGSRPCSSQGSKGLVYGARAGG